MTMKGWTNGKLEHLLAWGGTPGPVVACVCVCVGVCGCVHMDVNVTGECMHVDVNVGA